MTLTEFLLARIAEDEAAARTNEWGVAAHTGRCGYDQVEFGSECECDHPARVLAECEAKREVVAIANDQIRLGREARGWDNWEDMARQMLEALAAVYASHPDYREAWKP